MRTICMMGVLFLLLGLGCSEKEEEKALGSSPEILLNKEFLELEIGAEERLVASFSRKMLPIRRIAGNPVIRMSLP